MLRTPILVLLGCTLVASDATAQSSFRVTLTGAQENPPVVSAACGYGSVTLNGNDTLTYEIRVTGLTPSAAHIHTGAVGLNGSVLISLNGGPTVFSGTTTALSAGSITALQTDGLYVNVHSVAHSGGEIRGQIVPASTAFGARLFGSQENPPVATAASGSATFTLNANRTLSYELDVTGVTGTAAHIHTGNLGLNGSATFTLSGGPTSWSGTTAALSADQYATLQEQGFYVNVHSAAHSGGEIRGQIVSAGTPQFDDGDCVDLVISVTGQATDHGQLALELTGAGASTICLLLSSLDLGLATLKSQPVLLDLGALVSDWTIFSADGLGQSSQVFNVQSLGGSATLHWQAFNLDPGAPNGMFRSSNALSVELVDLP